MPPLVRLCHSIKSCSIYYGALNYEIKHPNCTNTVCLFRLTNCRPRKRTWLCCCILWKWKDATSFVFSSFQLFVSTHTHSLWDTLVHHIGVGDTNKPICCNCLSAAMYNVETGSGGGESFPAFPPQWQSKVLAVGRWCFYSEMAEWFPVYQNAYGCYNGHYFRLTWH